MVEVDFDGINNEEDMQGFSPVKEGQYHLVVIEADDSLSKFDAIVLKFEVLAGTVPGQEGKTFNTLFNMPAGSHKDGGRFCKQMLARLIDTLGIAAFDAIKGKRSQVDFGLAVGRQLIANVVIEPDNKGKKWSKVDSMNFWKVTDPAAAECPKDVNALALLGIVVGGNGAATGDAAASANAATTGQPAPTATQAAPAVDPFAGV